MTKHAELDIITRVYDLLLWLLPKVEKFPRSHKFTIGDRLENQALDILELLLEAKYSWQKRDLLQQANLKLEQLRFLIRLSKDLKMLSLKSYGHASKLINEVGRQIGGWVKNAR